MHLSLIYSGLMCVLVLIVFSMTILGNGFVIAAVTLRRVAGSAQNCYIASLAVADFAVGLLIIPFSFAREILGYWPFGEVWCNLHAAVDVLVCTSSINHICLIGLERYWSVTRALVHRTRQDKWRVHKLLSFVWLFSVLICLPMLLQWRTVSEVGAGSGEQQFDGAEWSENVTTATMFCDLPSNIIYVFYSAFGSFFIPSSIIIFVYIKIYLTAKRRMKIEKCKKQQHFNTDETNLNETGIHKQSTIRKYCSFFQYGNDIVSPSKNTEQKLSKNLRIKQKHIENSILSSFKSRMSECDTNSAMCSKESEFLGDIENSLTEVENEEKNHDTIDLKFKNKIKIVNEKYSQNNESNISLSNVSNKTSKCQNKLRHRENDNKFNDANLSSNDFPAYNQHIRTSYQIQSNSCSKYVKKSDRIRNEIRKKERRTTLVLVLITGCFIVCWLPFFILYLIRPLCPTCEVNNWLFTFAFWLGYVNSAINPIIYTIFNMQFKREFCKLFGL